jgi:hypothetical protein
VSASRQNVGLQTIELQATATLIPDTLSSLLATLKLHRHIAKDENNEWRLARDLDSVTLATLHDDLSMCLLPANPSDLGAVGWTQRYAALTATVDRALGTPPAILLRQLFEAADFSEITDLGAANGVGESVETAS